MQTRATLALSFIYGKVNDFFELVKESGNSSFKYLQNVYSNHDVQNQNVSVALTMSELFLIDDVFGDGACSVLKIRKYGGIKVL